MFACDFHFAGEHTRADKLLAEMTRHQEGGYTLA